MIISKFNNTHIINNILLIKMFNSTSSGTFGLSTKSNIDKENSS
jgi:hypothetical protein